MHPHLILSVVDSECVGELPIDLLLGEKLVHLPVRLLVHLLVQEPEQLLLFLGLLVPRPLAFLLQVAVVLVEVVVAVDDHAFVEWVGGGSVRARFSIGWLAHAGWEGR